MMEETYRVYNRCKYDIGVALSNGMSANIKAGSFRQMTATDIMYVESLCNDRKFFSSKMLVPVTATGEEVPFDKIGFYPDEDVRPHFNDEEITAMLKKPVKQIEAWIDNIKDPEELHSIYMVAKTQDLPASKLKLLNSKIPSKEWLDE